MDAIFWKCYFKIPKIYTWRKSSSCRCQVWNYLAKHTQYLWSSLEKKHRYQTSELCGADFAILSFPLQNVYRPPPWINWMGSLYRKNYNLVIFHLLISNLVSLTYLSKYYSFRYAGSLMTCLLIPSLLFLITLQQFSSKFSFCSEKCYPIRITSNC